MNISPINQNVQTPEHVTQAVDQQPDKQQAPEQQQVQDLQDQVVLSQKAKDIAAKNEGKAIEEETKESVSAKLKEAAQQPQQQTQTMQQTGASFSAVV
jgi:hypothetical protein